MYTEPHKLLQNVLLQVAALVIARTYGPAQRLDLRPWEVGCAPALRSSWLRLQLPLEHRLIKDNVGESISKNNIKLAHVSCSEIEFEVLLLQ